MKALSLTLCAAAAACGSNAPEQPDAAVESYEGGSLLLASCGYSVTTRPGATAPKLIPSGSEPLGPDPTPKQLHLGLAADPARSVVVMWRTNDDSTAATTVRFGKASANENRSDGVSFSYLTGLGENGPPARVHQVHLCGLTPDTIYHYQVGGVGSDGAERWSAEHTFRTLPDVAADPSAQITLLVIGDSRGAYSDWGQIVKTARTLAIPDAIVFTGDAVSFGDLQSDWDAWLQNGEDVLADVATIMVNGNHEGNALTYLSLIANPGDQGVFSLDFGAAHVLVLNDTPADPASITGSQAAFARSDLAAHATAPWKLFVHHQPMFSSAVAHGSNLTLRAAWEPIVDTYNVDLVLNGHDHNYERTKPLRDAQVVAAGAGAVYVVSGGAGATLYQMGSDTFTAFSQSVQNFVVLDIRAGTLQGRAYTSDGTPLDSFTMTKP